MSQAIQTGPAGKTRCRPGFTESVSNKRNYQVCLSELAKSVEGITAAENAARVAIYVYDAKGQFLGELAETEILTN